MYVYSIVFIRLLTIYIQLLGHIIVATSHMAHEAKNNILKLYGLEDIPSEQRKAQVIRLLKDDRFTCHSSRREVCITLF